MCYTTWARSSGSFRPTGCAGACSSWCRAKGALRRSRISPRATPCSGPCFWSWFGSRRPIRRTRRSWRWIKSFAIGRRSWGRAAASRPRRSTSSFREWTSPARSPTSWPSTSSFPPRTSSSSWRPSTTRSACAGPWWQSSVSWPGWTRRRTFRRASRRSWARGSARCCCASSSSRSRRSSATRTSATMSKSYGSELRSSRSTRRSAPRWNGSSSAWSAPAPNPPNTRSSARSSSG